MKNKLVVRDIVCFATVLLASAITCTVSGDDEQRLQQQFNSEIKPILQNRCGECHTGSEANAGLNFEAYSTLEQILDADRRWLAIVAEIKQGSMPPADAEQLTNQEQDLVLNWIAGTFELIDCSNIKPGNVTIRRLNRIEYQNSVRDLLGVDYEPAANFPGDDVGHGFDNVADVLSLPPILMEKYLDAAEQISQLAIVDPESPGLNLILSGSTFSGQSETTVADSGQLAILATGAASKTVRFPLPGTYTVRIVAYGDQAGSDPARMSLLLNGSPVGTVDVSSTYRQPSDHEFSLTVPSAGSQKIQIRFENDYYQPRAGEDRNLHIISIHVQGPKPVSTGIKHLEFTGASEEESAATFIREFVTRAFRRPVTVSERSGFQQLFDDSRNEGQTFFESLQIVTQAVLVSPEFLYRIEQPAQSEIRELDNFELATVLSFFLWSTTPDDELLRLAAAGELSHPEIWDRQVSRLLHSPRSIALVDNFAAQWLNLRLLSEVQPDPDRFPAIDRELLQDMEIETRMVVADIFRRDASVLELLDSEFTYVNARLAKHYGLAEVSHEDFLRVPLTGTGRSGVLTHASILTLTSNPDRTSPVKRGKWIMENFLGEEPPPPLADVKPLDDQQQLTGSLRDRMEQHRSDPSCASCHTTMDALGFALEHFDAVGRFRLLDDGFEIDSVSEMPDGTKLNGAIGLQENLRTTYQARFIRCFTEKLVIYSLGRGLKYYDRCTIARIMELASQDDYRFSAFVHAIANSETFRKRSGQAVMGSDR